jgi:putative flippase GtrA
MYCPTCRRRFVAPTCTASLVEMTAPETAPPRRLTSDTIRYLAIAIIGLVADLAIALTLRRAIGLPLPVATVVGFLSAVILNYVLLERFLFARSTLSWARLFKTYASAQTALLVRILSSWALTYVLYGSIEADVIVLIASSGFSFVINFVMVRLFMRK